MTQYHPNQKNPIFEFNSHKSKKGKGYIGKEINEK